MISPQVVRKIPTETYQYWQASIDMRSMPNEIYRLVTEGRLRFRYSNSGILIGFDLLPPSKNLLSRYTDCTYVAITDYVVLCSTELTKPVCEQTVLVHTLVEFDSAFKEID